jgi:hypothetical protein
MCVMILLMSQIASRQVTAMNSTAPFWWDRATNMILGSSCNLSHCDPGTCASFRRYPWRSLPLPFYQPAPSRCAAALGEHSAVLRYPLNCVLVSCIGLQVPISGGLAPARVRPRENIADGRASLGQIWQGMFDNERTHWELRAQYWHFSDCQMIGAKRQRTIKCIILLP